MLLVHCLDRMLAGQNMLQVLFEVSGQGLLIRPGAIFIMLFEDAKLRKGTMYWLVVMHDALNRSCTQVLMSMPEISRMHLSAAAFAAN